MINGSAYRWLSPFSTLIAAIDDILDDDEATPEARIGHARAVIDMFSAGTRDPAFAEQFLPLPQDSPEITMANGQVAQLVRSLAGA